jgi:hypothetical protein
MNSRGLSSGRRITMTPEGSAATRRIAAAQRPAELVAARTDDVAQRILDVHAHERRQRRIQLAVHHRHVHGLVHVILVAAQAKRPVLGVHGAS